MKYVNDFVIEFTTSVQKNWGLHLHQKRNNNLFDENNLNIFLFSLCRNIGNYYHAFCGGGGA